MFKWVEIAIENNKTRYEELSRFMNENKFENSVEFIAATEEEFPRILKEAMQKYDGIRIGRGLGEVVVKLFNNTPFMVNRVKAADTIVKMDGKWWLKSNAVDGFHRVLAAYGNHFDLESSALVVGAGAAARVAITGLFLAGFRHFGVSSLDAAKVETMIAELTRSHLGAEFKMIPKDGLILLPGTHSVLVNTTPLTEDNPMLEELYYFNFFKQGGLAVDFSISPPDTPLLRGAKDIGAHCIYGYQISAFTDLIWLEQIMGRTVDETNYVRRLGQSLGAQHLQPSATP